MENVYVLVTYLAALIGLVILGLLKVSDIFEQKRDRKYYEMIKEDTGFWQMKAEQTGMNIGDKIMDLKEERWYGGNSQAKAKERFDKMESDLNRIDNGLKELETLFNERKKNLNKIEERLKQEDEAIKADFEGLDEWLPF